MVSRTVSAKNRFLLLGLILSYIAFMQAVTAFAGTVTLTWDAPTTNNDGTPLTDLAGYKIHYGPTSGSYTNTLDAGNVTTSAVNNLTDGLTYYFAVTAYNSAGAESSFSNEVSKTLPPPQFIQTTFTITATAGIGGTITPAGTTGVIYGANQTITIAPSAGYHVATVLVDGVSKGAVTTYTFTSVTASHTIAASFAINSYSITASAGTGGAISPSGAVSANFGGNAIFSMTPNAGYSITDVKVDGVSKGAVTTYTFTNVTAAHTIAATFAQNSLTTITASNNYNTATFETGMDNYYVSGDGGFSTTQHHGGSCAFVIITGYYDELVDEVFSRPGGLSKTLNTRAGTMSVWAYFSSTDISSGGATLALQAGRTMTYYSGAGLHAGWYQYTHAFTGASSDTVSVTVGNSNYATWIEAYIDDIIVPVQ